MSHTLKINIWKLQLNQRFHKDKQLNSTLFGEIIKQSSNSEPLLGFIDLYVKSFNGELKKNEKQDKSFAPTISITANSERNIISGFLEGGITGIEQGVKQNKNINGDSIPVSKDDTVCLDYYFFLWIPPDVNYAYLMLHSYSEINNGISGPFFEHFSEFLKKLNYTISAKQQIVPRPIQEEFLKNCIIVSMDLIKNKTNQHDRTGFNPTLSGAENMKIRIKVSGLKYGINEFRSNLIKDEKGNPFVIDLSKIGFTDPSDYIMELEYKDTVTNKKTKAKLADVLNIKPTIVLPEDIKQIGTEKPDKEKIFIYCKSLLKQLQIEDGYATIDEF